jgi:hypothetical protein
MTAMPPVPDFSRRKGPGLTSSPPEAQAAYGAYANAQSQGASAPSWFLDMIIALGALTAVSIIAALVDTALLQRRPPAVRAQAAPLAARHPSPRMPIITRPGTWSRGSCAGSGCW